MAGRISENDIAAIKSRVNIVDVVADHVTLKRAGTNSLKGLCPFHDERTPSFTVNSAMGRYHCFGCQASGDAFSFLMSYQHLSFVEAVEQLAERVGYTITYEAGGSAPKGPSKTRLYAAHKAAQEFYVTQLASPEGQTAREFLYGRGFDAAALERFGVGYSPNSWDALRGHLRSLGFSDEELLAGGLVSQGSRGVYDRFRGRVMWPIRDTTGNTVGFGARKLLDSDQGPKYLNSPDSPIYHKAQVLYGIDAAKQAIAKDKRAIVVEGYTDVMACHLAGVPHAIATCGTAFGADHIAVLRRVLGDDHTSEVIFTFDPDSAGQAAALKAYGEEQRFNAQTYVADNAYGLDPSDLRQHRGDAAVRQMFEQKTPLFEFALRHAVSGYDLNAVAGRHAALVTAAPIILRIRDTSLKPAYVRELAKMVGVDPQEAQAVLREVAQQQTRRQFAVSAGRTAGRAHPVAVNAPQTPSAQLAQPAQSAHPEPSQLLSQPASPSAQPNYTLAALPRDRHTRLERDALMAMLQHPEAIGADLLSQAATAWVGNPQLRAVRDALAKALPMLEGETAWVEQVVAEAPAEISLLARELALAPLPALRREQLGHYARQVVISLLLRDVKMVKDELLVRLQRLGDTDSEAARQIQQHMVVLEEARRELQQLTEEPWNTQ